MISLLGANGIPANSTLTYFNEPELSLSLLPPYSVFDVGAIPSMLATPPGWLLTACPKITSPPQSPSALLPTGSLEVKTIGCVSVPSAIILQPLVMIKVPCVDKSPLITEPGNIVKVAPLVT